MEFEQIKSELAASYQDFRLSTAEKYALVVSFTSIKHDHEKLSYARNYAFEVVSESIRNQQVSAQLALKWLKGVVKSIDQVQQSSGEIKQSVYFSPGKDCERKIIQLINQAQFEIKVCVFTISNDKISKALVKAHKAGVNVKICSDNDKSQDLGSDIELMAKKGIEVRLDQTENHMHHKFAIFDNQTLLNGSYNWTRSASEYNDENIVVSNDSRLIERFNQAFLTLWSKCKTF